MDEYRDGDDWMEQENVRLREKVRDLEGALEELNKAADPFGDLSKPLEHERVWVATSVFERVSTVVVYEESMAQSFRDTGWKVDGPYVPKAKLDEAVEALKTIAAGKSESLGPPYEIKNAYPEGLTYRDILTRAQAHEQVARAALSNLTPDTEEES